MVVRRQAWHGMAGAGGERHFFSVIYSSECTTTLNPVDATAFHTTTT
jgi:hypothetical protein